VENRRVEYESKQEQRRRTQEAAAAQAQARHTRLEKLRELVAPHVDADPARVMLPTESSMGVDEPLQGAFKDVHSYTETELYKDQRFKVGGAEAEEHGAAAKDGLHVIVKNGSTSQLWDFLIRAKVSILNEMLFRASWQSPRWGVAPRLGSF
jgi:hypothetical protein